MAIQVKVAKKHKRHYGNWKRCISKSEQKCIYSKETHCSICEEDRLVFDSDTNWSIMKMLNRVYA